MKIWYHLKTGLSNFIKPVNKLPLEDARTTSWELLMKEESVQDFLFCFSEFIFLTVFDTTKLLETILVPEI